MFLSNSTNEYSEFRNKQAQLAVLLMSASDIMGKLNAKHYSLELQKLCSKIKNDSFKIQIVGTFKNGKSTFINSFLGENILPAYALPCTAVINEVKYGEKKRAVLHFKNPLPERISDELSPIAKKHINKYFGTKSIPPLAIPYERIEEFVVIPIGKDPREMLLESPYSKVELFWPLELLKNGIEIIDSPGLNEHSTRTKVTTDYLSKADAILFVMNATSLCTREEITFIQENLIAHGFKDTFFVVNRYDLIPEKEKKQIQKYAFSKLIDYTSFGKEGLFFVSAKNALDAKIGNDNEKLKNSGLPGLEKFLSEYLINKKGKLKLLQPARELKRIIYHETLFKNLPHQRTLLSKSIEENKQKYLEIKPILDSLKKKYNLIVTGFKARLEQLSSTYRTMIESNNRNLVKSVSLWIKEYPVQSKISFISDKNIIAELVDELVNNISIRINYEQNLWQKDILIPVIKKDISFLFKDYMYNLLQIVKSIYKIELFTANKKMEILSSDKKLLSDFFDNITLSAYRFLLYREENNLFSASVSREANSIIITQLSMCLNTASINEEIINVLGLNSKNIIKQLQTSETIIAKTKETVANRINSRIRENNLLIASSAEELIIQRYKKISDSILSVLQNNIIQCENHILYVIEQLECSGGDSADIRKHLDTCEDEIRRIGIELDKLTFELD